MPLISSSSSSSSRDQADTDNPYDDDQREIDLSEKRPLLSLHRNSGSRSSNGKNKNDRSTADLYLRGMNSREGFIEIDPATGTRIPHDDVEMTTEDILLKTMERSHEVLAASLAASDPSNETPVSAHAFETELMQKAKLVKLGIESSFISCKTLFTICLCHIYKDFFDVMKLMCPMLMISMRKIT